MFPVSDAFRAALTTSHTAVAKAEVWSSTGLEASLRVIDGSVDVDETAAIRRRCTCTLLDVDGTLVPTAATDLLHPASGNELRLYRGVHLATGDEYAPLGVFRLSRPRIADSAVGLTITVAGFDRGEKLRRNSWTSPYAIASGTLVHQAISDLLDDRYPGLTKNLTVTARTTPAMTLGLDNAKDPLADAQAMAAAIGFELFFDPTGVVVLRPIPDADTTPTSFTYAEGSASIVTNLERDLDDAEVSNGVIVTSTVAAVRYETWDADPGSPTYYLGSYGKRPTFLDTELVTTLAQATDAGDALLRRVLRAAEGLSFTSVVNAAHEAGDVVTITRKRAGLSAASFVLSSFTIPLRASQPMTAITRRRPA